MPHERGMCFGSLRCGAPRAVEEVALWRLSMLRRLGPSRGSSWLGGLFWGRVSRSQILSEDPLYGVINGRVCKRRGEHLAACRRTPLRRLSTSCRCRWALNCREAVRRWGQRPLRPLCLPQVQAQRLLMEVLGAERGLHLGVSAATLCNVCLFSSRMRSAESLLLNPRILDISGK